MSGTGEDDRRITDVSGQPADTEQCVSSAVTASAEAVRYDAHVARDRTRRIRRPFELRME